MVNAEGYKIAQSIEVSLSDKGWSVATAESCTGGGVVATLTAVPGSSACVKGGIVAYTEEVKMHLLGVKNETLHTFGVVSKQTVEEMAQGAMKSMNSDFAVATSGIAGPSGGTDEIPVGTIWVAAASRSQIYTHCICHFNKGRDENTQNAVLVALEMLQKVVENEEKQP
jgi:PncC family amidohydrolase